MPKNPRQRVAGRFHKVVAMADSTFRDGARAFGKGFLFGAMAAAVYQLAKNPGACSCCGCLLAISMLILVVLIVVAVVSWWTWISFIILFAIVAKLVADHLARRSNGDTADNDR